MKVLNRDQIKYMAIILMAVNHIVTVLPVVGEPWKTFFIGLGNFAYITMSYFLVEGFYYTSSREKYVRRLFIFGLISQLPFMVALTTDSIIGMTSFNVMFSLLVSFMMLWAMESTADARTKTWYAVIAVMVSTFCDWYFFAAIFNLLFYWARGDKKKQLIAYAVNTVSFCVVNALITSQSTLAELTIQDLFLNMSLNAVGFILSAICVLGLYNGKKSEKHTAVNKWFFYIFYPVHLLLLSLVSGTGLLS